MKAIVHIGFPKTGSTALQSSLAAARTRGAFLYPTFGTARSFANNHKLLVLRFQTQPDFKKYDSVLPLDRDCSPERNEIAAREWLDARLEELDRQLQGSDTDTCIFSAENFARKVDDFDRFRAFFESRFESFQVIVYARPAEEFYCSFLQQRAKSDDREAEFALFSRFPLPGETRHCDRIAVRSHLARYLQGLGRDRLTVVKFSRNTLIGGDILQDFSQRFLDGFPLEGSRENQSLSGAAIVAWAWLWQRVLPPVVERDGQRVKNPERAQLRKALAKCSPSAARPKLALPPAWAARIRADHQAEYCWTEDCFFGGQRGIFSDPDFRPESAAELPAVSRSQFHGWLASYLPPEAWGELVPHLPPSVRDRAGEIYAALRAELLAGDAEPAIGPVA